MAQKPRFAKVAVVRGELALFKFQEAAKDGAIDGEEIPAVLAEIQDWFVFTKATNAADALGDAVKRGVSDEAYRRELLEDYFTGVDSLPRPAA